MKRITALCVLLLMLSLFSGVSVSAAATTEPVTINVYNWGQYMALGEEGAINVNEEFTKKTGIKVNYMTFDSNETMYTKLKTGGSSYDIIVPSDYMVSRLIQENMLEKLDMSHIPNYKGIEDSLKNPSYDPKNEYSVPYTYGNVGLIYNTKYIKDPIDSWSALWDARYAGRILMFDNPRDAFGIAESLLGYSLNTTDETEIQKVFDKLQEQRPLVEGYVMDQIYDQMENEEAWIAPYYAGDCLAMMGENPDLQFVFPKEGFNTFVDAFCIPTSCQHKAEAEAYINFLCDPEISGQNCDYLGYSTPVPAAKDYMDEEMAASPIAYPDEQTMKRGEIFENLPVETLRLMDADWSEMKINNRSWVWHGIVLGGVVLLLLILWIVKAIQKRIRFRVKKTK